MTFAYGPHAEPVLRGLDLTVPEGNHLAIVGPSGIGKSTLAGLLWPDAGTVTGGGTPAAELAWIGGRGPGADPAGGVFAGTVRENLTYLRPDATRARIAAVGADHLVARLGGLAGEPAPAELSAGERQLVALAGAYPSPAELVVLDGATCHLDPAAERRAEEAFAARGGTLTVIAHRISSALRARRILVLDGAGAAVGDHHSLRSGSPLYRQLLGHWGVGPVEPVAAG